ncbi:hypothetical protein MHBO_001481 [Bonamia ostreae]|uniref:Uncharacterized protein n=1 Tax=Bonamia ostreae TaxID=126728 RepID=A0ABV2AJ52_9EUKA
MMTIDRVSFVAICVVLAPTLLTAFLVIRKCVVEKIKIGNTEKLLNSSKTKSFVSGKKVLITGGNKGIGYSTAIEFCRLGATVLITCRDVEKGRIAIQQIENKVKLASINFKVLDLLELQSVRDFAGEVLLEGTKFDFLINNAGFFGEF